MWNKFSRLVQNRRSHPVVLCPSGRSRGTVVVSYISWPLRDGWDLERARGHTNAFEVCAMAESWLGLGFRVEVVDHGLSGYRPPRDTKFVIDLHSDLERWHAELSPACVKILHATGSHWLEWNQAETNRLCGVRDRRGVALLPRRQVPPSASARIADCISVLGNQYTMDSFGFSGKSVERIPISSAYEFLWPEGRDFEMARRRFLWVGSYGMVHKGLDLVLDAFSQMPGLELTVCGRPQKEADFFELYETQLTGTSNIHFHGWMDMASPDFLEMARTHATILYPSSAEGGAGSVIHCMHAGLLPVCTWEASVDLGDFGVPVRGGTVGAVCEAARFISELSAGEVEARARRAWEHARNAHTQPLFRENYQKFSRRLALTA